jgi:hypothetical protein
MSEERRNVQEFDDGVSGGGSMVVVGRVGGGGNGAFIPAVEDRPHALRY